MTKPSPSKARRQKAERSGRWAETFAAFFLQAQFFRIRARRVKTPVGEIDLVAERHGLTIFVEVKARAMRTDELIALESVNQRRIDRAADYYIARHPHLSGTNMRFDVIFLAPMAWPRHVKDAFTAH